MSQVISISRLTRSAASRGQASPSLASLLQKGFRPFFLLAGVSAAAMVPLWLLVWSGYLSAPRWCDPSSWHAHEMLFGYATAVIAGFLLTAASRWTGRETATGAPLLGLALLWLAGRVVMFAPAPLPLKVIVDCAFIPALLVAVARAIVGSANRRNYGMLVLLFLLAASNLTSHLAALGVLPGHARAALAFGLDVIVLMMVVIGARVIPMFTRGATGVEAVRSEPWRDRAAVITVVLSTIVQVTGFLSPWTAPLFALTAVLLLVRSAHWGARPSLAHPLLWILHAGNSFIALGFALRAWAAFYPALGSAATHAFTAGAIGSLTLGMMCRVSLGHTGRPILPSKLQSAAFGVVVVAGALRVAGPFFPEHYARFLAVAGTLWSLAFTAFVWEFAPLLTRPRIDGEPG